MIPREKVAVLIPVYNEAAGLGPVLDRLKTLGLRVCVVDDGSTDGSGDIARGRGVETLAQEPNAGKGAALRRGFRHLADGTCAWIVVMDGDGQHRPEEIPRFLEKAASGDYGVVNGDRLGDPRGMPALRLFTNRLMSFVVGLVAGQRIPDTQCGFKMLSADFVRRAHLGCDRFEIEDELLLEAARLKYKITSVPVTTVYADERSHIRPFRDTVRFLRFISGRIFRKASS
jgi:glycosyltransferase involved in cell wall biosynthesis